MHTVSKIPTAEKVIDMERISGNVSHAYYFASVPWSDGAQFTRAVLAAYPDAKLYDRDGDWRDDPWLRDLQTAENFLHGGGQTYDVVRAFPQGLGCTMLVFVPDSRVLCVSHHYGFSDASGDELIELRQSGQFKQFRFPDGKQRSFHELAQELCCTLLVPFEPASKSFLLEITGMAEGYSTVAELEAAEATLLYGLISGDEGYQFVPREIIDARLKCCWGSREFIRLYAYEEAFLFVNLIDSAERRRYLDRQEEFGNKIYGGVNDYFYMGSCPLTVNHGILFSVEFVMVLKALINGVMSWRSDGEEKKSFYRRIRETNESRKRVLTVLHKAENVEISEIGAMGYLLQESQHITPLVEKVKYMLELLEGDLDLMYSERNNILVTVLTVLGLVLALLQVILAVI